MCFTCPKTFAQQIAAAFSPLFPPWGAQNSRLCSFSYHQCQQKATQYLKYKWGKQTGSTLVTKSEAEFYLLEKTKVAPTECGFLWHLLDVALVRIQFCKSCNFISGFQNLSSLQWPILFLLLLLQSFSCWRESCIYNPSSVCKPLQSLQGAGTHWKTGGWGFLTIHWRVFF